MKDWRRTLADRAPGAGFPGRGTDPGLRRQRVAGNHKHHWDPSYREGREEFRIQPPGTGPTHEVRPVVIERLGITEPVQNTWRADKDEFQVFTEKDQFDVNLATGAVVRSGKQKRPVFYDLNFMHRNGGHGVWTVVGDIFAGILVILALSGIFLVKGRKGVLGRGGVLLVLGVLVPLVYTFWPRVNAQATNTRAGSPAGGPALVFVAH